VAPNVAIPILMTGSVGTNLVIWSASSGSSENAVIALPVDTTEVMIEEVRAYRRRDWRRRKKAFQSRTLEEVCGGSVDVDALRVRHSDGVKKDDGVLVDEGGAAASGASLEDSRRGRLPRMSAAEEAFRRDCVETSLEESTLRCGCVNWRPSLVDLDAIVMIRAAGVKA